MSDFHKNAPSLTEFWKVSGDKQGYFFKRPKQILRFKRGKLNWFHEYPLELSW